MSRVPTVRKADLDRAIKALADAGLSVASIEVKPGGVVIITPLTPGAVIAKPDSLDAWRARKHAGRAAKGS